MTRVKICGIKDLKTALFVTQAGASSLGFVFFERSVRNVPVETVRDITSQLPAFIHKTGVFVDQTPSQIIEIVAHAGLDTIQLHGGQDTDFIAALRKLTALPIVLAVRAKVLNDSVISQLSAPGVNSYLIDKFDPDEYGGTGERVGIDSELNQSSLDFINKKVILAGGINSKNARSVIDTLHPYGLDLSSGVEKEKGIKDLGLIRDFFESLKV